MAISKRTRYEVLRRDSNTCRYCRSTENALTVDHVIPTTLGGSDDPSNLVAACKDCNAGKSSTSPEATVVAQVSEDALRWAAAMEAASAAAAKRAQEEFEYVEQFDREWLDWGYGPQRTPVPRPSNWESSVKHWRTAGLPIAVLTDAARTALANNNIDSANTWRYFCGIAWSRVRQIQDEARGML